MVVPSGAALPLILGFTMRIESVGRAVSNVYVIVMLPANPLRRSFDESR